MVYQRAMDTTCGWPLVCSRIGGKEATMLHYSVVFLVIALIAAVFGFGGVATAAAGIAKLLFFVFLVLFAVSMLMGRRGPA